LFNTGKECPNGDVIGAGGTYVNQSALNDRGLLVRTSSTGDSLWMFTYEYQDSIVTNGRGRFFDVLPTADGGFIAAGVVQIPFGGPYPVDYSQDTWVVKVDSLGCIVPGCTGVGIEEQVTNLLGALRIYPDPVAIGQPFTLELELPGSLHGVPLTATVVGADGKVLWQQALGSIVGRTSFSIHLPGPSAGMYYVHISSQGKWLTGGKLIVQ
jgi:hypothetical protein